MTWTWWMTLLVIFAVLLLIGCIPVGVEAKYNSSGAFVSARIWLLKIQLIPKKEGKKKKPAKQKKKKTDEEQKPEPEKKKSGLLSGGVGDLLSLFEILTDTLGNLRRKLRVDELMLHVTYKGSDPAKAAVNYGMTWAAIGAITPYLERIFVIKKRDIQPVLDYNEAQMKVDARLTLTITIARILALVIRAGIRFLGFMAAKKKNEKGGANNESSSI